jgi:hypothetical protein
MTEPPPKRAGGRRPDPRDHTPERIVAVAAVAGLLLVLIVTIGMIAGAAGDGDDERAAVATATPTETPEPTPTPKPKPTPVPLTDAERAERDAAAEVVESRGFEVVRLRDYDPRDTLRVLIGRTSTGSHLAFFFVQGQYIGNDSTEPSARLRVRRTGDLQTTLRYGIYQSGDEQDKPTGDPIDVGFKWDGSSLQPLTALPAPEQRTPGRFTG